MTRGTSPRVIVAGVSRRFGDQVALDRVSVTVEPGDLVAIIGRSGARKTTLIRWLSRSLVATEGSIRFGGEDVRTLRGAALRAHRAQGRRDLSAVQPSLTTMRARNPEIFKEAGATIGGFVPADDGKYQVIRDLNETAKRLAAQK